MYKHIVLIVVMIYGSLINDTSHCLPANTSIRTPDGSIAIEHLLVGSKVTSFDDANNSYPEVLVEEIIKSKEKIIVEIKLLNSSVLAQPEQEFYDVSLDSFIPASALSATSILFSPTLGNIPCSGIVLHDIPTQCYKLSLGEPHLFFSSGLQLLTHNYSQAASFAPKLAEMFAGAAIIAYIYVQKGVIEQFDNLTAGRNKVFKELDTFLNRCKNTPPTINKVSVPHVANPPTIAGITPDEMIYNYMRKYPQWYSPIIVSAEMDLCGDVICSISTIRHYWENGYKDPYLHELIGRQVFPRSAPLVQPFVQEEDKKQLDNLRDFIKTWPAGMSRELFKPQSRIADELKKCMPYGSFDRTIHKAVFGIHAIRRMIEMNIAPSKILYSVRYGRYIGARHPERLIFYDQPEDIVIVVEKTTRKIVTIGRYSTDIQNLNEPSPEQDEEEKKKKEEQEKKDQEENDPRSDIDDITSENKIKHLMHEKKT